jgi:large subunit ribosomal protein L16
MLYIPRSHKFKKVHRKFKINFKNSIYKTFALTPGYYFGIISLDYAMVTDKHLELLRVFLTRTLEKKGLILRRISITHPLTKKASQSRMGKGVGKLDKWVGFIQPGSLLFELQTSMLDYNEINNKHIIEKINKKLHFNCQLIEIQKKLTEQNRKDLLVKYVIKK